MKYLLISLLSLITITSLSQTITRGPGIGEIYFRGPTHTGVGLYYSTNFGQTAICVDSTTSIISIAADKNPGGIYCFNYPSHLWYSNNYGYVNSWDFKNNDVSSRISSGIIPGHISSSATGHSEDFGENFTYTSCNGCFGSGKRNIFDNVDENIGYLLATKVTVADTIYLLRSYDKFENAELIHNLEYHWSEIITLTRGYNTGEVFMFNFTRNNLWISYDYFDSLIFVDAFNIPDFYNVGTEGGNQTGEFNILYSFENQTPQNRHIYIFHSTDYGKTFDIHHPYTKGNQPVIANFSTANKEPFLLTEIEFDNFSIGDNPEYQWDFENDGVIDSYEEFPVHIYQDTGYYSVALTVVGQDSSNTFIKENYIYVIDTITSVITNNYSNKIKLFPNPFTTYLTIQLEKNTHGSICIYNTSGELERKLIINTDIIIWDGTNNTGQKCLPGIYYIKINKSVYKVLLTK